MPRRDKIEKGQQQEQEQEQGQEQVGMNEDALPHRATIEEVADVTLIETEAMQQQFMKLTENLASSGSSGGGGGQPHEASDTVGLLEDETAFEGMHGDEEEEKQEEGEGEGGGEKSSKTIAAAGEGSGGVAPHPAKDAASTELVSMEPTANAPEAESVSAPAALILDQNGSQDASEISHLSKSSTNLEDWIIEETIQMIQHEDDAQNADDEHEGARGVGVGGGDDDDDGETSGFHSLRKFFQILFEFGIVFYSLMHFGFRFWYIFLMALRDLFLQTGGDLNQVVKRSIRLK
ncbi:uncharacterized protein LODBEIA_P07370 [Lodderomyces beijingensis]|uniref:Uncharacterized protein n=1 Tax=Lodderomyces beijingensis TaxID=1775926 RepID=A0ABP0ZG21_9ASCO